MRSFECWTVLDMDEINRLLNSKKVVKLRIRAASDDLNKEFPE